MAAFPIYRFLQQLKDVVWGTPSDQDVLTYDAGTQKAVWAPGGGGDLSDAVILAPDSSTRNLILPTDPGFVPLVVKAAVSQTAHLQEWMEENGVVIAYVGKEGALFTNADSGDGIMRLGFLPESSAYSGIWIGQVAPDTNNYSLLGTPGQIFFNAPGSGGLMHFRVNNSDVIQVASSTQILFGSDVVIAYDAGGYFGIRMFVPSGGANVIPTVVRGAAAQAVSLQEWQDSGTGILTRIDKSGYFMTRKVTAPAGGDLATSELAVWFDDTSGAAKFEVNAKDAGGAVRTGYMPLGVDPVPAGGTTGQVLAKASNSDWDDEWVDVTAGPSGPAGGVLDGTYPDPGLAASVAGDGLAETADVLSVNVDNASIEISGDTLEVKDGGITAAKLAFTVTAFAQTYLDDADAATTRATLGVVAALFEDGGAQEISIAGLSGTSVALQAHLDDATDAHAGTAISNTPAGTISATTTQAAINELDTEKTTAAAALAAAQTEIADQKRVVEILVTDPLGSAITTGDGKAYFRVPPLINGHNLVSVGAAVSTVSSSGIPTVQLRRMRLTTPTTQSPADMLSTKLTIDASEFDSKDATTAAVIDTSNDDVQTGDQINIDIDVAGTGTKGLVVSMTFEAP